MVSYINSSKVSHKIKPAGALLGYLKYFILLVLILGFIKQGFAIEPSTIGDFNGDSIPDLVIGNLHATVNGKASSGEVQIQYGNKRGIAFGRVQNIDQESPGIPGKAAVSNQFGFAVAKGDFDNDGFEDLVIGAPSNDLISNDKTIRNAGAITALYGSNNGLQTNQRVQLLTQNSPGVLGASQENDEFGQALATGDFNGDGFIDLAVSASSESIESENQVFVGAINIISGSSTGLSTTQGQLWTLEDLGFESKSRDNFGLATASGDFNNDGFDDLAISAPSKKAGGKEDSGVLYILYGSTSGLHKDKSQSAQRWIAGSNGFPGEAKKELRLGKALAVGNFNGDDFDDLAIGLPGTEKIVVLKGSTNGLQTAGHQVLAKTSSGMPGNKGLGKEFGWDITARDINSDGFDDLFVAARGAPILGSVMVSLNGSANGLNTVSTRYWTFPAVMLAYPAEKIKRISAKDKFRPKAPITVGDVLQAPEGKEPTRSRDHRTKAPTSNDKVID